MDLRAGVIACACLGACGDRAQGSDRAPATRVSMRWPSSGDVVASPRPRVRWRGPTDAGRVRVTFCADRGCDRLIEAVETDGRDVQPTRPLPTGVVFWRAFEAVGPGEIEASGPTWWFVVPRVARDTPERASRDLGWAVRDVDGDGRWDPLDLHGVLAERVGGARVVRTWLAGQGSAPVTVVGDLDGDGYVDFAGADPLRDGQVGRVLLWRGPLPRGGIAPWRAGAVGTEGGARCGASASLSGDFDGDGRRELVVSCPGALGGRGEVRVVALEGEGLGRTLATLRGGANGYRALPRLADAGTHALVAEDLDDDGYDDLVVGTSDARCAWEPVTRACAVSTWIGVYLGGPAGLAARVPLVLPLTPERVLNWMASAAVFDAADGARGLALGAAPLMWVRVTPEPALTLEAHVRPLENAQNAALLVALPQAGGDDRLITSDGGPWFEVTRGGEGGASWRRLQSLGASWTSTLAEVADVQGDGVPDLVVHAVTGTPERAVIFAWMADANGRVEVPTQITE